MFTMIYIINPSTVSLILLIVYNTWKMVTFTINTKMKNTNSPSTKTHLNRRYGAKILILSVTDVGVHVVIG